jgi:aryl-alcohol dehydrogenase-like predicted oxidoreductase
MQHRPLGRSGLSIAPIMLGGNVFGWTADLRTSHLILDAFVHAGFNAIDTADVYSMWAPGHAGGESETVIGQWLSARKRRDDVIIATKLGKWPKYRALTRINIVAACEESLTRLRTDHIDLYQAHEDDATTPLDETLEAFAALLKAGKVRAIGASNYTAERLKAAEAAAVGGVRYETLQPLYNLMDRVDFESALQPWAQGAGVSVIPYYGLASGFLTGKYRSAADLSKSPRGQGVRRYLDARGLGVLGALDAVAARHNATPAQVALAWVMGRATIAASIVSATSEVQLKEILGAATLALTAEDVWDLDRASAVDSEDQDKK